MKVQLSKDDMFSSDESPIKALKIRQIERQRAIRIKRMNPKNDKPQSSIEIIDPLPQQLQKYKNQTSYRKSVESSKASQNLRKYIIEQQKNLRCLRLEKIDIDINLTTTRTAGLKMSLKIQKQDQTSIKQINIPKIEDTFKNQSKELFLYENTLLKNKISKIMGSLDSNIIKSKIYLSNSNSNAQVIIPKQRNTHKKSISDILTIGEMELDDKALEHKFSLSQNLQKKIGLLKRSLQHQNNERNTNFTAYRRREKKKIPLEGVRSYLVKDGKRQLMLTPASSLLFQLHKLSNQKQRKQSELTGLLKNSYQNRDSILNEKSQFYSQENPFNNLSDSHKFQLRKTMNRKLSHRLELSREQVNNFISYLRQIKEDYHVVINEEMLEILKEVRQTLLSGKVMKLSDLEKIIKNKNQSQLKGKTNQLILTKLTSMMI